jgi:hypothetical protein
MVTAVNDPLVTATHLERDTKLHIRMLSLSGTQLVTGIRNLPQSACNPSEHILLIKSLVLHNTLKRYLLEMNGICQTPTPLQ